MLDALEPEAVASLAPAYALEAWRQLRRAGTESLTRRGAIELLARADRAVPEEMAFIPFCFAEAAANTLTNPALDPFGKIPEFKYCAAEWSGWKKPRPPETIRCARVHSGRRRRVEVDVEWRVRGGPRRVRRSARRPGHCSVAGLELTGTG